MKVDWEFNSITRLLIKGLHKHGVKLGAVDEYDDRWLNMMRIQVYNGVVDQMIT